MQLNLRRFRFYYVCHTFKIKASKMHTFSHQKYVTIITEHLHSYLLLEWDISIDGLPMETSACMVTGAASCSESPCLHLAVNHRISSWNAHSFSSLPGTFFNCCHNTTDNAHGWLYTVWKLLRKQCLRRYMPKIKELNTVQCDQLCRKVYPTIHAPPSLLSFIVRNSPFSNSEQWNTW